MSSSLRLRPSNTSPRECRTRGLSRFRSDCRGFFEQAEIYVAFAGFLGDEVPEVADLLLADTVDAAEALFEAVGVPRQIVVHHQVGA